MMTNQRSVGKARSKQIDHSMDQLRGLFDGFEGYRTPTEDDYRRVLTQGLVVPDTNVLLNLYRYNAHARDDLFAVLDRLGEQLWVPHQVLVEFWRNRESALRDPQDIAEDTLEKLKGHYRQAIEVFRAWANRVSLPNERIAELDNALNSGFTEVTQEVEALSKSQSVEIAQDTNKDPVLQELERILKGRVGGALDGQAHKEAVTEGKRRVAAGLPPGYKDKQKSEDEAAGDYLVWEQVLGEAERRKCDVLLVTGDVKDDWWRKDYGQIRGPRLELVEEMWDRAKVKLFMLRPESLLRHARSVLDVEVQEASVQDVERVDRFLAEGESKTEEPIDCGWTARSLGMLLRRLSTEGPVQEAVIRLAAEQGGFVSREEVYELGEYDAERSLRGFTRPVSRIAQELRDAGVVPDNAVDVLLPVYDPTISSFQKASGFRIPQELIPLIP